jgi:uncharacterized protein with PIN domain
VWPSSFRDDAHQARARIAAKVDLVRGVVAAYPPSLRAWLGAAVRLNIGDCFAYALSVASGEPLLFTGDDFAQTDVAPAPSSAD